MKTSSTDRVRAVIKHLGSPGAGIAWVLGVFIALSIAVAFLAGTGVRGKAMIFLAVSTALIVVAEACFRFGYRLYVGRSYDLVPRLSLEHLYIEPHPYIPFIYKRHFRTGKGGPASYPLHQGRFFFGQYTTNNLGFPNGPAGDRDVAVPKPAGLFRVNCLGASTTGNYIERDGEPYSYPAELEKLLRATLPIPVEVNNCGQGGYNSADIFVRFALQIIDTQPDVVVIYHGYNDIRAYLTRGFDSDYSHSRRNLAEVYWKFTVAAQIPAVKLKFLNFLLNQWLPVNIRYSLLDQVATGIFDPTLDPSPGLRTYRRNLQHTIDLCRANGIAVILSTYCHFLYDAIAEEPIQLLYHRIVAEENDVVRDLARENGIPLVDNALLVPLDARLFLDSIHFTPEGMRVIAGNIAEAIRAMALRQAPVAAVHGQTAG